MPTDINFTAILDDWAEVYMARSMHDMVQFIKNLGISMPQLSTLMHLHYRGACGVSDIGGHLGVTSPAASQMIDRMVQQGLLEQVRGRARPPCQANHCHRKKPPADRKSIVARRKWMEESHHRPDSTGARVLIVQALNLLTQAARDLKPLAPADITQHERSPQGALAQP